ncbi:hypothetical protein [Rhizobium leguminosarum]|uniref:hypothetical protein n=1 Tax=Rhizobium leguminosarum TaxID=384 RepID=UPI003F9CE97E
MEVIKRVLTREELHELVWSTPMQKLAEIFGLSDRGLAKTCDRHLVPVPGRGYWAKIEAGQHPRRTPLRSVENPELHVVQIGSKPIKTQSPYVAQALAAAAAKEIEREDLALSSVPVSLSSAPDAPKAAPPSQDMRPLKLPQEVRAFIAELRRLQPDRDGFVYLKYVKVPPSVITRVESLIGRLTNELARYGFTFSDKTNRLGFSKDGSTVDFEIKAPRKRIAIVSKSGWKHFEYQHIGRFEFRIYGWADGVTKQWGDKDGTKIEDWIPKIVESFRLNLVAERERDEQTRQQAERKAHLAHRRKLAEQRAKREEDRLNFLRGIAEARREAAHLRDTIASVPQSDELPDDYARMILWAEARLRDLERQTAIERIQESLVEQQLFTAPDHLSDPEGDPPPKVNHWDD